MARRPASELTSDEWCLRGSLTVLDSHAWLQRGFLQRLWHRGSLILGIRMSG